MSEERGAYKLAPEVVFIDARVAVIASVGADEYYHWLLQILGRLAVLEASGEPYDYIYLMPLTREFQEHSLRVLGIPTGKILFGGFDILGGIG